MGEEGNRVSSIPPQRLDEKNVLFALVHCYLMWFKLAEFVDCGEKIQAVSCGDEVVTLLSEGGKIFSVDPNLSPFTPR